MKVSDSLDNVPNENVVTTGDRPTDRQSDQLLELLEWLFATKNEQNCGFIWDYRFRFVSDNAQKYI